VPATCTPGAGRRRSSTCTQELAGVVGVGSTVYFMIGANGFDTFDSTDLAATISQAPEPFGALLLALGLVMLCFRRR